MNKETISRNTYRDLILYGRGGKKGKQIRLVSVTSVDGLFATCEAWWVVGPRKNKPPPRVNIMVSTLLNEKRYGRVQ